jgi:predicted DNA-binding transcriptional regulator AlpA
MTNEFDRLMTITRLSEMLGVPVDTLYGWRHRGDAPRAIESGPRSLSQGDCRSLA